MSGKNSIIIGIFFLLSNVYVNAQHQKIKTYYEDGKLESKGSLYTYSYFYEDKRIPKKLEAGQIQKKEKEWKYWYQNGQLRRIENYKLVKDKNFNGLPHGKWVYFNETGTKYREDTYENGVLVNSIKEIYYDTKLAGKVSYNYGVSDTLLYLQLPKVKNLIKNPNFDFFYYKPILITYNGKSKIEEWIPFWTTPGEYTPDYISNLRYIDALSYFYH